MVSINQIKQLRKETGISITECKKALEEAKGDLEKAREILRQKGAEWAQKKTEREAGEGIIEAYIHSNKKVGVLLDLRCETDFVARSEDFGKLAHELSLQIAGMNPEPETLLEQPFVRDPKKTVADLMNEYGAKLGEKIEIKRFVRYEI